VYDVILSAYMCECTDICSKVIHMSQVIKKPSQGGNMPQGIGRVRGIAALYLNPGTRLRWVKINSN
jgi:hypothetical protein